MKRFLLVVGCFFAAVAADAQSLENGSNHSLVEDAKIRARNSLPEADGGISFDPLYQKVRVVGAGSSQYVCGEVRSDEGRAWTKFHLEVSNQNFEVDPHPDVDPEASAWFGEKCQTAVRNVARGTAASIDERRSCQAGALFALAAYHHARFEIIHEAMCGS